MTRTYVSSRSRRLARFFLLLLCIGSAGAVRAADVSTFLEGNIFPRTIGRDVEGNLYVCVAELTSDGFARTAAVLKLDPSGTQIRYKRQFGGNGYESPTDMAVAPDGSVFLLGTTTDRNFPTTAGAFQSEPGSQENQKFLVALNPDGSTRYSTFASEPLSVSAIAVNAAGEVYLGGLATGGHSPKDVTLEIPSGDSRAFLIKLDATGTRQLFAVKGVSGSRIALDSGGNVYLAGSTGSPDFPTTPGAWRNDFEEKLCSPPTAFFGVACSHVVISKVNAGGTQLVYTALIAGSGSESVTTLTADKDGAVYLGISSSSPDFPVTPGAFDWAVGGCLTKLSSDGSDLQFSSCLGAVTIGAIVVRADGSVVLGGGSQHQAQLNSPRCLFDGGIGSAFVAALSADGSTLTGLRVQPDPSMLVAGAVSSPEGGLILVGQSAYPELYANRIAAGFVPGGSHGTTIANLTPDLPVASRRVACIRDAADDSFVGSAVPGRLMTLFGSGMGPASGAYAGTGEGRLPFELGDVRVTFDGLPAPLSYAGDRQVNFVTPFGIAGRDHTTMRVVAGSEQIAEEELIVAQRDAHAFGRPAEVIGTLVCSVNVNHPIEAAVNPDWTRNSCFNPAPRHSVVAIFVNGLGITGSELPDGSINPVPPPRLGLPVEVSNPNFSVEFAGAAALAPSGVWQINLRVNGGDGSESFRLNIGGVEVGPDPFVVWVKVTSN